MEVFQWKGKKKTLTRRSNPCLQARRVEDQREAGIRSFPADRVVLTHRLPTGSITLSISSSGRCFHALSQTKPDVFVRLSIQRISRASTYLPRVDFPIHPIVLLRFQYGFQSFVIRSSCIRSRGDYSLLNSVCKNNSYPDITLK